MSTWGTTKHGFLGSALFAATLTLASSSLAHDHWIELDPFITSKPTDTKVYLMVGEDFHDAAPVQVKRKERYDKATLISAGKTRDILKDLREDEPALWRIRPAIVGEGSHIISLEAAPRAIELSAPAFQAYLAEERLVDILVTRALTGTEDNVGKERYSRSMKAILQVGAKLDPLVTQPVGAKIEIVPDKHPYSLLIGQTLTVQLLFDGKPLAGRALTAANRYRGDVATKTIRTDNSGKATFLIDRTGDWLFHSVHMVLSKEADVHFRSYWASMTFGLPDGR